MELDPVFVKALRLLHSRSKDSVSQLRSLYEEALKAKRTGCKINVGGMSSPGKRRDVEKRNFDKLKRDLSELVPCNKRSRLGSPGWNSSKSHTPSPTPPGSREDPSGGNSSCGEDPGIGDLEMNLDNLTCVICKSLNQENGNILMECHTCQNLYHQECHSPMVSNDDADDPRLIWHCSQCSKTIKRMSPSIKTGNSTSGLKSSSGSRQSPSKTDVPSGSLFKRIPDASKIVSSNVKSSSGNSSSLSTSSFKSSASLKSSSSNRLLSKPHNGTSHSLNGSSSSIGLSSSLSSCLNSSSNIISVDKRLQMMKKKAASRKKMGRDA
ncbi:integrator complex subunit 12 isoform X2 [Lepeophtheirus salmonis]|uniref:integrator complex subunit 12 isoform X2 n=1 Tax=Lepeophtheirus salmonis TaxID=72036 RepID=UPI003AF3C77E